MVGFCLFDPTQGALPALTRAIMAPTAPALTWTLQGGFTGPTSVHSSSPPTQHLLERRHTLEPPVWFCQTERRRSGIRRPFRSSSSRRLDTFGVKKIKSTATNLSTTTRRRWAPPPKHKQHLQESPVAFLNARSFFFLLFFMTGALCCRGR